MNKGIIENMLVNAARKAMLENIDSFDDIDFLKKELKKHLKKEFDLQDKLEEKDKIIDEIDKRCNQEISAAMIQYERHKRNDTWQYIIVHKRILEILERGKSENNTN